MNPSSSKSVVINRNLVGVIAIVMLVGAGILWVFTGTQNIWTGACLKVGLVMGALWMALPAIARNRSLGEASWFTVIAFVGLALLLTGKRVDIRIIIPLLAGIAIATLILRPRPKTRHK
ncbi:MULTISPECIES: hypothetical protein [unclassified Schlesneria]|uniref:hypothetical protein n=1 Tax=unclassified Schlesneria TaxID=2762017 RepID=UPI002EEBB617